MQKQPAIFLFARLGDALRITQENLDCRNFYAFNPSFDKKCNPADIAPVAPQPSAVSGVSNVAGNMANPMANAQINQVSPVTAYKSLDTPVSKVAEAATSKVSDIASKVIENVTSKMADMNLVKAANTTKVADINATKVADVSKVADINATKVADVSKVADINTTKVADVSKVADISFSKTNDVYSAYQYNQPILNTSNYGYNQVSPYSNPSAKRSKRSNNGWG